MKTSPDKGVLGLTDPAVLSKAVLRHAPLAIISNSADGTILSINPAGERMLGYSAEELIGKHSPALFHDPEEVKRFATELSRKLGRPVIPGSEAFFADICQAVPPESQWTYVRKDGSRIPVLLTAEILRDAEGKFDGTICIARDISEGKKMESELRESETLFRTAFEHAPIGIALVGPDGHWLRVNRSLCDLVGFSEKELLEGCFQGVTHPEDLEADLVLFRETMEGKRDGYQMEKRYIHKNGRVVRIRLSTTLVRNPDRSPRYFISQIEDVTAQHASRQQLQDAKIAADAANRAKSDFLAMMSHEIRTPLNSIIGFTSLLSDTSLSAEQIEYVSLIETSGESLLVVINDVLDYSKIEAGKIDLENTVFSLPDCVQASLDMVSLEAGRKKLRLLSRLDPAAPCRVVGDGIRVRQILSNLLANAVKFTHQGEVVIEVQPGAQGAIRFEVRDTGIGIPAHKMAQLFQPFNQLDASTTRRFGGTGLGLAICSHLAKRMGGTIEMESRENEGTVARVVVPLPAAEPERGGIAPAKKEPHSLLTPAAAALRILIAEDNITNQRLITQLLKKIGVTDIRITGNGGDVLTQVRDGQVDLILMDCQMPVMDGYEASREIRRREKENPGRPRLQIIALTAAALDGARQTALDSGMDDYLTKPVHLDTLAASLNKAAARR